VSPVRAVVCSGGGSRGATQAGRAPGHPRSRRRARPVRRDLGRRDQRRLPRRRPKPENVPLAAAVAAGADEVWALGTGQLCEERHWPRSAVDVALQALAVQSTARTQADLACLPPGVTVHHLVLPCVTHRWHSDFSGSAELIASGAAAAWEAIGGAPLGPSRARQRSHATKQISSKSVVDDSERRSSRRRPSGEAAPSVHDTSGCIGRHNHDEDPGHEGMGASPASAGPRPRGVSRRFAHATGHAPGVLARERHRAGKDRTRRYRLSATPLQRATAHHGRAVAW
jgi:hypothetical protein